MTITIGTTPTIIFNNFQIVRVGEIKEAVLTIKQGGMYSRAVLIKRDLSTADVATVDENLDAVDGYKEYIHHDASTPTVEEEPTEE